METLDQILTTKFLGHISQDENDILRARNLFLRNMQYSIKGIFSGKFTKDDIRKRIAKLGVNDKEDQNQLVEEVLSLKFTFPDTKNFYCFEKIQGKGKYEIMPNGTTLFIAYGTINKRGNLSFADIF